MFVITQEQVEKFPDMMIDIETTGTDQAYNHIIQIAAVRFNLRERTIFTEHFFDRALLPAPNRYWQESCRQFWGKRPEILQGIMNRMEDPRRVLIDLRDFAGSGTTFWGKPTHFDHAFLDGYFKQFEMQIPFHYRAATDMNSFIRGRYFPEVPPPFEKELEFVGEVHNAIHDCLHQIKVLFKATEPRG